jgi:hypothetical protein
MPPRLKRPADVIGNAVHVKQIPKAPLAAPDGHARATYPSRPF